MMLNNRLSYKIIAKKLFISPKTLNTSRYTIYKKLNIKTDIELMILADQTGLMAL